MDFKMLDDIIHDLQEYRRIYGNIPAVITTMIDGHSMIPLAGTGVIGIRSDDPNDTHEEVVVAFSAFTLKTDNVFELGEGVI